MKRKIPFLKAAVLLVSVAFLEGCASSPTEMHTFQDDMATLRGKFEETQALGELPESSFLADWEEPLIVPRSENIFSERRDIEYRVHRVEDQYFYRTVGSMEGNSKDVTMGSFGGDVAALSWELRTGIALWEATKETSIYHEARYFSSGITIPAWTEKSWDYVAYFLVKIPKNDRDGKDAWMLGMNVRNMDYDDRTYAGRNTGVLVTNVYDNKPAFFVNVRPGHVVIRANGKDIITMEDWRRETAGIQPGVPFEIVTADGHGEMYTEKIIPAEIPADEELVPPQKTVVESQMVKVEGGSFKMGDDNGAYYEKPVHEVEVNTFYMCNHEVTQAEWKELMGQNPSYAIDPRLDESTQPVERITWLEAIEYCNRRSDAEGLERAYSKDAQGVLSCNWNANGYRLPTEAEWEYVARGGKNGKDKRYAGGNGLSDVGWYADNAGFPHPVMEKKPNRLGIYDLTGNVSEWCWDKYNNEYYEKSPKDNPKGAGAASESLARIIRGADAFTRSDKSLERDWCTVFTRFYGNQKTVRSRSTGLRVVRTKID